jgi:acyl-CoA-binding protein
MVLLITVTAKLYEESMEPVKMIEGLNMALWVVCYYFDTKDEAYAYAKMMFQFYNKKYGELLSKELEMENVIVRKGKERTNGNLVGDEFMKLNEALEDEQDEREEKFRIIDGFTQKFYRAYNVPLEQKKRIVLKENYVKNQALKVTVESWDRTLGLGATDAVSRVKSGRSFREMLDNIDLSEDYHGFDTKEPCVGTEENLSVDGGRSGTKSRKESVGFCQRLDRSTDGKSMRKSPSRQKLFKLAHRFHSKGVGAESKGKPGHLNFSSRDQSSARTNSTRNDRNEMQIKQYLNAKTGNGKKIFLIMTNPDQSSQSKQTFSQRGPGFKGNSTDRGSVETTNLTNPNPAFQIKNHNLRVPTANQKDNPINKIYSKPERPFTRRIQTRSVDNTLMTPDGTITTENISNLEKSKVELLAKP